MINLQLAQSIEWLVSGRFGLKPNEVDAFESFRMMGVETREEAHRLIKFVLAQRRHATVSFGGAKRDDFETFMQSARSLFVRVAGDWLLSSPRALESRSSAAQDFDNFLELLAEIEVDGEFWHKVNEVLGTIPMEYPLLDPAMLLTWDIAHFNELVGKRYRIPSCKGSDTNGDFAISSFEGFEFLCSKSGGLSLRLNGGKVAVVFLYGGALEGFKRFPGKLIGSLSFRSRRRHVRSLFGEPLLKSAVSWTYDLGNSLLTFNFNDWWRNIRYITIECKDYSEGGV